MGNDPTMGELGEFTVIDRVVAGRRLPAGVVIGPGDDAAVLVVPDGHVAVSTDMLVEGRHFRLDWSTPRDIGRKAIAQNAADIEAMGGRPTAYVVGFGAPPDTPARQADDLSDGMWEEAAKTGAGIVGGDLVSSPQWVVSVTVLGDLEGRAAVPRGDARPGAVVAVAGELGRSAAGYGLWLNGIDGFDALRRRHLVPTPPYGQGAVAAEAGALAMTDVSDGLIADLGHIAAASGVTIDVSRDGLVADHDAVLDAATAVGADPWEWVFGGGEDHALVACFPDGAPPGWRPIGVVIGGPGGVVVDGRTWTGSAGWESFQ
jgi:thiamine-monophosphate kinase